MNGANSSPDLNYMMEGTGFVDNRSHTDSVSQECLKTSFPHLPFHQDYRRAEPTVGGPMQPCDTFVSNPIRQDEFHAAVQGSSPTFAPLSPVPFQLEEVGSTTWVDSLDCHGSQEESGLKLVGPSKVLDIAKNLAASKTSRVLHHDASPSITPDHCSPSSSTTAYQCSQMLLSTLQPYIVCDNEADVLSVHFPYGSDFNVDGEDFFFDNAKRQNDQLLGTAPVCGSGPVWRSAPVGSPYATAPNETAPSGTTSVGGTTPVWREPASPSKIPSLYCQRPYCTFATLATSNLKRHMNTAHNRGRNASRLARCCNLVFSERGLHQLHVRLEHGGGFKCPALGCRKTFTRRAYLDRHLRSHDASQKVYACHQCDYTSSNSSNFRRHLSVHQTKEERDDRAAKCKTPKAVSGGQTRKGKATAADLEWDVPEPSMFIEIRNQSIPSSAEALCRNLFSGDDPTSMAGKSNQYYYAHHEQSINGPWIDHFAIGAVPKVNIPNGSLCNHYDLDVTMGSASKIPGEMFF